jgi:hypothetical protein
MTNDATLEVLLILNFIMPFIIFVGTIAAVIFVVRWFLKALRNKKPSRR